MINENFKTIECLKELGFVSDASILAFDGETLSYDFGNLTLSARQTLNRNFVEIISVSGVYATGRNIAEIEIQLPLRVISIEQCAAFIGWGINRQVGRNFVPSVPTRWLDEGRNNFDTLPWIRKQKLYDARPQCTVERDWLRLTLRDLRSYLSELADDESLTFAFQAEVFSIRSRVKLIAFPATGNNWNNQYEILACELRHFPRRLNNQNIEISIWDNSIQIANFRYPVYTIQNQQTL